MATKPLPKRLIGYGAYTLAFDPKLGGSVDEGVVVPDFFDQIRANTHWQPVNHVRVICFWRSTVEGMPADRTTPLFGRVEPPANGPIVNPRFLDTLKRLVVKAGKPRMGFWVQICLFNYHAVAVPDDLPENMPHAMRPVNGSGADRLRSFFSLSHSAERVRLQKQMITEIATHLKDYPNIIWEIGNELRISRVPPDNKETVPIFPEDNCKTLCEWMNAMKAHLLDVLGQDAWITSSTGSFGDSPPQNEEELYSPVRSVKCGKGGPFLPNLADLHAGQWEFDKSTEILWSQLGGIPPGSMRPDSVAFKDYPGMDRAWGRMRKYFGTVPPILLNDDGTNSKLEGQPEELYRIATNAFIRGFHYTSKQPFPSQQDLDKDMLDALCNASSAADSHRIISGTAEQNARLYDILKK